MPRDAPASPAYSSITVGKGRHRDRGTWAGMQSRGGRREPVIYSDFVCSDAGAEARGRSHHPFVEQDVGTLEDNLAIAWEAVRHVKGRMKFGAKNKLQDLLRSRGQSIDCVNDLRADEDKYAQSLARLAQDSPASANERLIEFRAALAASHGCGNCAEQAALAFVYLRDKAIFPLDYMVKPDVFLSFGGHAFVVVGRDRGSAADKPSTWGPSAAVADPHETATAYPASKIEQHMPKAKFESWIRMDSASDSAIRVKY
jgi:hypothetical protein